MMRISAASMLALSLLLLQPHADAAEGRVSDIRPAALDPSRTSSYSGKTGDPAAAAERTTDARVKDAGAGKTHVNKRSSAAAEKRSATIQQSDRASYFYIYDAGSLLIADRDGDAYHSEFRIRFDADATFGDALVYARFYLRRVGEVDWLLYHETDDFVVYGQAEDDDYYVTTTLDDGFATAEYDVLIDLYEVGYDDIVATIGPLDSGALGYLPLEEVGLDVPLEIEGFDIEDVTTTLLIDSDGDEHYSKFRIAFDPDADFDGGILYARIWVRPQGGTWFEEHVSDDFLVDASGGNDLYSLTADWISGYPTSYYDVQIDLHDSATGLLAASAGSERPELSRIPLEDASLDRAVNPPVPGGGGSVSSHEHGGGALTPGWALALLLLACVRIHSQSALSG